MEIVHKSVLLEECLEFLSPIGEPFERDAFMVDSTLGEGGHSFAFLSRFPNLKILGLDADSKIQERAKMRLSSFAQAGRMNFWNGWFNDFYENYDSFSFVTGGRKPDLILFDLGISVFHYEKSGRGFSFRHDEPLDMRLDESAGESAEQIVNTLDEKSLADLIFRFSDEKKSRKIARAICEARTFGKIESASALAEIVKKAVGGGNSKIHPATKTFQALRIAVNGELSRLPSAIHAAFNALNVGGKMGVITFHSIEDRIVKNYFRALSKKCVCPPELAVCACGGKECANLLTKKGICPTENEIALNSPSRSAKLRVVRKLCDATKERFEFSLLHKGIEE